MTSFVSFTADAAVKKFEYTCECIDTGLECDGMENLNIAITGNEAEINLGSYDWEMNDTYFVEKNVNYIARTLENKNYNQFKIVDGGGMYGFNNKKSSFLVSSSIAKGEKKGSIKFQSVSSESTGGGFWSWFFECKKD